MPIPLPLASQLAAHADAADAVAAWPAASWDALRATGALRWGIPTEYGGDGLQGLVLLEVYQHLAAGCLTATFILSQRDAAIRRLRDSGHERLCRELLPPLAAGECFTTVGLSQLTTSRQHVQPTLAARLEGDAVVLDGVIPWVTGAAAAQHLLIGAVLDDGRQVLLVLPTELPGVRVGEPLDLMALRGSMTAEVRCEQVRVEQRWLLAGPAEKVLTASRAGTGGLETSCLALGLTRAALEFLQDEATKRAGLEPVVERLRRKEREAQQELRRLAWGENTPENAAALRGRVNLLVLQATQAALTAAKGTGFVRPHPAQRWARQALFFLVWSCPWPVASATLDSLLDAGAAECF